MKTVHLTTGETTNSENACAYIRYTSQIGQPPARY